MGKRILFVARGDENMGEGFSYALDLARAVGEDIVLLVVRKTRMLMDRFEDLMSAVAFAEEGDHKTARAIAAAGITDPDIAGNTAGLVEDGRRAGVNVQVSSAQGDMVSAVKAFIKSGNNVDMVVLSPGITDGGEAGVRELGRLVKGVSRPVVAMSRQQAAA
jgi:hypothetical protein